MKIFCCCSVYRWHKPEVLTLFRLRIAFIFSYGLIGRKVITEDIFVEIRADLLKVLLTKNWNHIHILLSNLLF